MSVKNIYIFIYIYIYRERERERERESGGRQDAGLSRVEQGGTNQLFYDLS